MKKKNKDTKSKDDKISRKDALKKAGKYAAFTAAGMMLILKPTKSYAASADLPTDPGSDW